MSFLALRSFSLHLYVRNSDWYQVLCQGQNAWLKDDILKKESYIKSIYTV